MTAAATEGLFAQEEIERLILVLMLPVHARTEASRVLAQSRSGFNLGGPSIREDRLHVTLLHIGDYAGIIPPSIIAQIKAALEAMAQPPIRLAFNAADSFMGAPGKHPHVLLGEGLIELQSFRQWLRQRLLMAGVKMLSRAEFNPHVTLAYGDRRLERRGIDPIRWEASEFLLVHSEVGRSTYHELGRWMLDGPSHNA